MRETEMPLVQVEPPPASGGAPRRGPRLFSRRAAALYVAFVVADSVAIAAFWGAALWRSSRCAETPLQALHVLTEAALMGATLATVVGLCCGWRSSTRLAVTCLASLVALSLGSSASLDVAVVTALVVCAVLPQRESAAPVSL